jgi:carboxyl-terminal processing protease
MRDLGRVSFVSAAVAVIVCAVFAFGAGNAYATHRAQKSAALSGAPTGVDLTPLWKAWNIINANFVPAAVSTTSPMASTTAEQNQNKVWGLLTGLADSLNDPYTFFLPPTENQQFSDDMSGQFEGVGMEIDIKDGILTVVTPLKGTPAEAAGIKTDDQIIKIDGIDTKGLDVNDAVKRIRGPKGTQVALMVLRAGWAEPREIKVTRQVINVPIITTEKRSDGIFVITFAEFTANSPELFRSALREFVESGSTKLILDMRGNPGGYLDAAVDAASWFLPAGSVVVTEDYAGHAQNIVHRSSGYDIFNDNLKMVILVDQGTASASEILSDALRYYGKAKLVGMQTYGKGVVQELFPITSNTSLKVTVARWLGPDGEQIPTTGIIPDIVASTTEAAVKAGKDPQMDKAVQVLEGM